MKKQTLLLAICLVLLSLFGVGCADKTYVATNHSMPTNEEVNSEYAKLLELVTEGSVYFDVNQDIIKPEFYNLLHTKASILRKNPTVHVQLEGNTDITGTNSDNYVLAELRARAVFKHLLLLGVSPSQLSVVSYGQTNPLFLESTEFANAKNRRVDFKIIPL